MLVAPDAPATKGDEAQPAVLFADSAEFYESL
jgi:hypothetical protein